MAKSQLNNMSKKEILQSLMYEQNQSTVTLSRLVTAVARTAGLDPEELAKNFVQDKENQEFVEKFNNGVKSRHTEIHAENAKQASAQGEEVATEDKDEEATNSDEEKN